MSTLAVAAALLGAFLLGSIPFGVVFARLRGIDLRSVGSGNIGATNAARALGKKVGALVLVLDAAKAYLPVIGARRLFASHPQGEWIVVGVGLLAVCGHLFSPWLRFRGGKGVASGLGVFLAIAPASAGIAAALWVACYAATRISSVGSLVATTALVPLMALRGEPLPHLVLGAALYLLILGKHRGNLRRLLRREEKKV